MRPAVRHSQENAMKSPIHRDRNRENSSDPLTFTLPEDCPARLHLEDLEHPEDFTRRLAEWLMRQR